MMDWVYQLLAWFEVKASSFTRLPVTVPVAFVGVILCFFMVPSTRKLSLVGPTLFGVPLVAYCVNELGTSNGWSQGVIVTVAAFAGFFTLAGLIIFGKVHEKLLVDDKIINAVIDIIRAVINRIIKLIGADNDTKSS